jgi:hypothetical protein
LTSCSGWLSVPLITSGHGTATTLGYGDILARGWLPHLLAIVMMLTVVPLFGAAFSLFTSGLASVHVIASEARMKAHIEARLKHHLGGPHEPKV